MDKTKKKRRVAVTFTIHPDLLEVVEGKRGNGKDRKTRSAVICGLIQMGIISEDLL